jgi:hypothetical protein
MANVWGQILGGAGTTLAGGLVSSLFGQKSAAPGYTAAQQAVMDRLGTDRAGYDHLRTSDSADYSQFHPQANNAVQNYAHYLEQDPGTNQQDAADYGKITGGLTDAYLNAQGNIVRDMLSRGFSPNSSVGMGASVAANNAMAQARSGAYSDIYNNRIAQRGQRLGALTSLLTGAAGNARGNTMSDISSEAGIDQSLAGMNGNLALQAQERADQQNTLMGNTIGAGVGAAARLYGASRSAARSAAAQASPVFGPSGSSTPDGMGPGSPPDSAFAQNSPAYAPLDASGPTYTPSQTFFPKGWSWDSSTTPAAPEPAAYYPSFKKPPRFSTQQY